VVKFPESTDVIYFGEPLLLKAIAWWHFGTLEKGFDIVLHPTGFAAWFGMLATAMNLLPFGQLDGGHIAHAVFGSRAKYVSLATLAVTVLLTLVSLSWISMAVIMLAMAFFLACGIRASRRRRAARRPPPMGRARGPRHFRGVLHARADRNVLPIAK